MGKTIVNDKEFSKGLNTMYNFYNKNGKKRNYLCQFRKKNIIMT